MEGDAGEVRFTFVQNKLPAVNVPSRDPEYTNKKRTSASNNV